MFATTMLVAVLTPNLLVLFDVPVVVLFVIPTPARKLDYVACRYLCKGQPLLYAAMMSEFISFRTAEMADLPRARELMPMLADFDVPARRDPTHLWDSDLQLFEAVLAGSAPNSFAEVATGPNEDILGLILVTLREELMSHAPSAHLEAIVVAPEARGRGLGRQLLKRAEALTAEHGARSLSLHVFANNHRARSLYDASGYDSELIRAIKWFD